MSAKNKKTDKTSRGIEVTVPALPESGFLPS